MRLPNGFGSVYKLSGNRRRPFVVKKTIDGKQRPLGYFSTHDEALTFLLKYNHEPTGLTATFADIYEQWKPTKWPALSESSRAAYENSFRHLSRLHDKTMSRLKYLDLQAAMDDVRKIAGYSTQKKCRVLMSQLYQFAIKREMATTDYSRYVEFDGRPELPALNDEKTPSPLIPRFLSCAHAFIILPVIVGNSPTGYAVRFHR